MRIISGEFKGRKINAPKKLPVRPTTDMAKEALFNIINNQYYFDELIVLDLFSGTGNISYEFASRGTTDITCVDHHLGCIKFINETSDSFNMGLKIIKSDVYKFLEQSKQQFHLIFADPPYNFSEEEFLKIVDLVFTNKHLATNGILILEHSKHTRLETHTNYDYSKSYGGNSFSFFISPS